MLEFARGTRARRALSGGTWPGAFGALVARNRRRYGGYIVHAAMVLLAIGVAGSSAYDSVVEGRLSPGQTMRAGDYDVTFRSLDDDPGGERDRDAGDALGASAAATTSAPSGPGRTPIPSSSRSRTRSGSAATGCAPRTCS